MYFRNVLEGLTIEELILYLRKSRSDDPTLSVAEVLAKHEQDLQELAVRLFGQKIPEKQIYREVASSETLDDRPEMVKVLRAIENPKIKAIICIDPQRLSRGRLSQQGQLIDLLQYTKTMVITMYKTYDLEDEYDREAFERELKRGNEYLEYAKKVMKAGRERAVKSGQYISTARPYGYKHLVYKDGKKRIRTLEIIPQEAEIVKMIFDWYAHKGLTPAQICDRLDEMKVKPMKKDFWKRETISAILRNPTYIGKVRWYRRRQKKSVLNQEIIVTTPNTPEEMILVDGLQESIIDEALFNEVQARIKSRHKPVQKNLGLKNYYAGIAKCGVCGRNLKLLQGTDGINRLVCPSSKHCNTGTVYFSEFEESVIEALSKVIKDFEMKLEYDNVDVVEEHNRNIKILENRLEELRKEEISQWQKYTVDKMPKHIFDVLNKNVLDDIASVEWQLSEMKSNAPVQTSYEDKIYSFKYALKLLKDESVSAEYKNEYMKDLVKCIKYTRPRGEKLTIARANELDIPDMRGKWLMQPYEIEIELG